MKTGKLLEGIIRTEVDFPILLEEDFSYEIIGRLKTSGTFAITSSFNQEVFKMRAVVQRVDKAEVSG